MTKSIKMALISIAAWLSIGVDAAEVEQISLEAKPDVVVESITMLMPYTTKKAMETLSKFQPKNGSSDFFDSLNNVNTESGVKFEFNGSHVYSPYTDSKHSAYKNTVLYKMWNTSDQGNQVSLLPIMREFSFEAVLGFFNKVMFAVAMFFVVFAIGRMAWVSMTTEEENKSWTKLIVMTPAIMIAILLITPMPSINGVNMAQMAMVMAILFGNFIAANFSIVTSYFLFQHIVNTSDAEDNVAENMAIKLAASNVNDIAQELTKAVNTKIFFETKLSEAINDKLLKGKELTDANLQAGIDEYNKKLGGHHTLLTSECFREDWLTQYFKNPACSAFINGEDYKLAISDYTPDSGYSHTSKILSEAITKSANLNASDYKFNVASHANAVNLASEPISNVYHYLLNRQKEASCASLVTSLGGAYSSFNNKYYYDYNQASRNFLCKKRNANGGFDEGGKDFYGLVLSDAGGDRLQQKSLDKFDDKYVITTLHSALLNAISSSQINKIGVNSITDSKSFNVRGFFISPLEAVVEALIFLDARDSTDAEIVTPFASQHSKLIVLDAIYQNREISANLGDSKFASMHYTKSIKSEAYRVEDVLELEGWRGALFDIEEYVEKTEEGNGNGLDNLRLKTIEPYSHLLSAYDVTLPLSMTLLLFSGAIKVFKKQTNFTPNTSASLLISLIGFLGGLLFLMSMTIKLLTGVLFLYGAICLVFSSFKRLLVFLIASTLMAVKFLKENFSEVDDDEENITVSRYVVSAIVRLIIDMSMITVAIICTYIIGTFAANLMGYGLILFMSTMSVIHESSIASIFTLILGMLSLDIAIAWGVYKGIQLMPYIYTKTTDFVEDISGVNASEEHSELIGFVQQHFTPTSYVK